MNTHKDQGENAAKSPRQWSAEEKFQVVLEAAALSAAELGAFLRRKGLHAAQLEEWRALATAALANANKSKGGKQSAERKRIAALERELLRKDKARLHARAFGAKVTSEPNTYPFGERQYSVLDLGGRGTKNDLLASAVVYEDRVYIGSEIGGLARETSR
jgi:transposase-like protein